MSSSSSLASSSSVSGFYVWEYMVDELNWQSYPPSVCELIDVTRGDGLSFVQATLGDGFVLYINLRSKIHTNLVNGSIAPIRQARIGGAYQLEGVAEAPVDLPPNNACIIEAHRRMGAGYERFPITVTEGPLAGQYRIDIAEMTWTRSEDGKQGPLTRWLDQPARLTPPSWNRPGRTMWVPRQYCSGHYQSVPPPISAYPSPSISSSKDLPKKDWVMGAPAPALQLASDAGRSPSWSKMTCLAYGSLMYQAENEPVTTTDLLKGKLQLVNPHTPSSAPTHDHHIDNHPIDNDHHIDNHPIDKDHHIDNDHHIDDGISDPQSLPPSNGNSEKGLTDNDQTNHPGRVDCRICHESVTTFVKCKICRFEYCLDCLNCWLQKKDEMSFSRYCPQCKTTLADCRGPQPSGTVQYWILPSGVLPVPGYPTDGTILIIYDFPNGEQLACHENPGAPFRGDQRVGFFPFTKEGLGLLRMFLRCFAKGRMFSVATSLTTNEKNTLVWGGVHHKTTLEHSGMYGYPDPKYFDRVKEELLGKGIHPDEDDQILFGEVPTGSPPAGPSPTGPSPTGPSPTGSPKRDSLRSASTEEPTLSDDITRSASDEKRPTHRQATEGDEDEDDLVDAAGGKRAEHLLGVRGSRVGRRSISDDFLSRAIQPCKGDPETDELDDGINEQSAVEKAGTEKAGTEKAGTEKAGVEKAGAKKEEVVDRRHQVERELLMKLNNYIEQSEV